MAEIIRGGFNSVDRGQVEAADSLGLKTWTKIKRVIVPQAMPSIVPATGNQLIGMFKETALVSVLGVSDLLQWHSSSTRKTTKRSRCSIVASIWYLIMTSSRVTRSQRLKSTIREHRSATITESYCCGEDRRGKMTTSRGAISTKGLYKAYGTKNVLSGLLRRYSERRSRLPHRTKWIRKIDPAALPERSRRDQ